MSNYKNLPAPSPENGLSRYLQEIRKFPMLEPEQEYMLAKRWIEEQDSDAAHQMVTSHLRLAAKIAMGYRAMDCRRLKLFQKLMLGLCRRSNVLTQRKVFVLQPMPCGGYERVFKNIS